MVSTIAKLINSNLWKLFKITVLVLLVIFSGVGVILHVESGVEWYWSAVTGALSLLPVIMALLDVVSFEKYNETSAMRTWKVDMDEIVSQVEEKIVNNNSISLGDSPEENELRARLRRAQITLANLNKDYESVLEKMDLFRKTKMKYQQIKSDLAVTRKQLDAVFKTIDVIKILTESQKNSIETLDSILSNIIASQSDITDFEAVVSQSIAAIKNTTAQIERVLQNEKVFHPPSSPKFAVVRKKDSPMMKRKMVGAISAV